MNEFTEYDYLCHYGILGMKWGVRRFQNPDGSLTPEGRSRYNDAKIENYRGKLLRKAARKRDHAFTQKNRNLYNKAYKNIKNASRDELAVDLFNKNKKAAISAGVGVLSGTVSATLGAIMGKSFINVLNQSLNEVGFDLEEMGITLSQDKSKIVKSYLKKTTIGAAEGYVMGKLSSDRKTLKKYGYK